MLNTTRIRDRFWGRNKDKYPTATLTSVLNTSQPNGRVVTSTTVQTIYIHRTGTMSARGDTGSTSIDSTTPLLDAIVLALDVAQIPVVIKQGDNVNYENVDWNVKEVSIDAAGIGFRFRAQPV